MWLLSEYWLLWWRLNFCWSMESQMIYIPPTLCAPHESNIKYVGLILLIHFSKMVFSIFFWCCCQTKFTCYYWVKSCWRCCWFVVDCKRLMEDILWKTCLQLLCYLIHTITHNLILFITTKEITDCTSFRFLMMILEQTKYDLIW